jgi:hypothetical protein
MRPKLGASRQAARRRKNFLGCLERIAVLCTRSNSAAIIKRYYSIFQRLLAIRSSHHCHEHPENLNAASRVLQLKEPLVWMYSWVYQKVQSSLGSIDMLL